MYSIKFWIKEAWLGFLEFIYPIGCRGCSVIEGKYLCDSCFQTIVYIDKPRCKHCCIPLEDEYKSFCPRCAVEFGHHDGGISIALYDDPIGKLIRELKYEREKGIAAFFSKLIQTRIVKENLLENLRCDYIHPVPLSRKRFISRGFNQSGLIAKKLAEAIDISYRDDILTRIRDTESQAGLGFDERLVNIRGAFKVADENAISGKSILLVDDVMTTGATIEECARTLNAAGASKVKFITVARQIFETDAVEKII